MIPDTPKDILTRLNLLLGTRRAGNNSVDIRNEIAQLIDIAAAKNAITSEDKKGYTKPQQRKKEESEQLRG